MCVRKVSILILVLLTVGCVSQSKYDESLNDIVDLQERLNETTSQLEQSKTLIDQLEQKLGTAASDKESMKKSVEEMKLALSELAQRKQETEKRIKEYRHLVDKFKTLTDAGQLEIKIVDGRMVVVLPSDVLFGSGSANLSENGVETIKRVGKLLSTIPDKEFQIEGHTDNIPIKTSMYPSNWELASARALTVTKVMLDVGVPGARISAASFGQFKPAMSNSTSAGRDANRRIEIVIVPDLSTLPGYDELQKFSEAESLKKASESEQEK